MRYRRPKPLQTAHQLPLPTTAAERAAKHDPRKSVAERYASRDDYLHRYSRALDDLVKQRWILEEDRAALLHRAEQEWDEAAK